MSAAAPRPVRRALMASVLTGLIAQAALMVSGVLVARMLGVENRGALALLIVGPMLIVFLGGLGLPLATTFEIARNPTIARPMLRRLRHFVGLQTMILTLLHGVILVLLVNGRAHEVQVAAVSTIVIIPGAIAFQHGLAVMLGEQRYSEFNLLKIAPSFVFAAVAVAAFVLDRGTLPLLTAASAASWLAVGLLTLILAIRGSEQQEADAALPDIRQLVRFGARSMLGSASPSDGAGIEQVVIGLFLSTRAVGLYVVAAAFMNLSRLVAQSIGFVAYPHVAAHRVAADAERAMWRFAATGVVAAGVILIALELVVDHLIVFFFGDGFAPAAGVARILLLAAFFLGARRVLSDAARGFDKPLAGSVAEAASWAVLIPAMIVLTPLFGLHGVAWALVLAALTSLCVIVWRVRKPLPATPPEPEVDLVALPNVVIGRDV
ncbi:MAG: oligosaccharide flippase family protein [Chloroflexi bacterium]|nr:oligosaccharide flippase family protein [Chloroflexota bacterium]